MLLEGEQDLVSCLISQIGARPGQPEYPEYMVFSNLNHDAAFLKAVLSKRICGKRFAWLFHRLFNFSCGIMRALA
jgi:hypothetical protein